MKKFISAMLASIMIVVTLGFGACKKDEHVHTFDTTKWVTSETEHWHAATCGHTSEVFDLAAHDFEIMVTRVSTAEEAGEAVYTCKVCNYSKNVTLQYGNHEHIVGWTSTRAEHVQSYICCDAPLSEPVHGAHAYGDGAVCSVCGTYSVLEDATDKLNNGLFSYTLVIDNVDLPLSVISEGNSDIRINGGAFKLGLDKNYMLTLVGTFNGSVSEYVEVGPESSDKVTSLICGKIAIDNNKVYVISKAEAGAMKWEKGPSDNSFYSVGADEQEFYAVYDLNEKFAEAGIDNFSAVFEIVLDEIYGLSDELKAVVDAVSSIDTSASFDKWFVENADGSYTLNFGVINDFNEKAKDATIGSVLAGAFGEKYAEVISGMLTVGLNLTVGDILDFVKAQGVDIYELNEKLNDLIAAYYPGEENTIEEILVANGFPIAEGLLLADYIDSKPVRAYKVIDLVNIIGKAIKEDSSAYEDLAVEDIVATVSSLIESSKDQNVYELAGTLVTMIPSFTEVGMTINGSNIYTIIDELGKFLSDFVHIDVKLADGKLVEASFEISYTEPEEPAEGEEELAADDGNAEDSGEGEEEPAEDPLNEMIRSIMLMVRGTIANFKIELSLNDSEVGVDATEIKNAVNNGIKAATPTTEAIKAAIESEFEDVQVTEIDGRDYVAIVMRISASYDIHKADAEFVYSATVKFGGYVDEILNNVNYYDRCGEDFVVYFDVVLNAVELIDDEDHELSLFWRGNGSNQIVSDEELAELRNQYDADEYPVLFGEYNGAYDITLRFQYTKDGGFTIAERYGKDNDPENIGLHGYKLVSGEKEKINDTYYTKLVYECEHCGKTVVYYAYDSNVPYTESAAA